MNHIYSLVRWTLNLLSAIFLLSGCATGTLAPGADLQGREFREIALAPVTLEKQFDTPQGVDIGSELRSKVAEVLRKKGYKVVMAPMEAFVLGAVMEVRVDELFYPIVSDRTTWYINIFATAELKSPTEEVLWRDEARASMEGVGYEFSERLRLLEVLSERLLRSLPPPSAK